MPRDRRDPPAVRVYTVCDESRYLIVRNVPALGCGDELAKLFGSYGDIEECKPMDAEDSEPFTDVYWIKFWKVNNARFAKRKLDEFVFYGNRLQVSYAPQFESLLDTKEKLEGRRNETLTRIKCVFLSLAMYFFPLYTSSCHSFRASIHFCQVLLTWQLCKLLVMMNHLFDAAGKSEAKTQTSSWQHGSSSTHSQENEDTYASNSFSQQTNLKKREYVPGRPSVKDSSISHVSSNEDYFSSPSMNETVQLVREKLDKIKSCNDHSDDGKQPKKSRLDNRRRI